jgi:hypothetical protein
MAAFAALDEHTAALDPKTADFVLDLTRTIVAEQRLTTMMVTHSMRQALDCGERTRQGLLAAGDDAAAGRVEINLGSMLLRQHRYPEAAALYRCAAARLARVVKLGEWFEPAPGFRCRLWNAGHILGSSSIEVEAEGTRLLYSGDAKTCTLFLNGAQVHTTTTTGSFKNWQQISFSLGSLVPFTGVQAFRISNLLVWANTPPSYGTFREALAHLRGHNLACWCALTDPCHADTLLEFANR